MQSTEPRVLMEVADGDVRYVVFTPLDEEARGVLSWVIQDPPPSLFEERVAFADGQAFWVLEEGNHADYVYQSLLCTGIEMCWPSGESVQLSQEALDDYDEMCESILSAQAAARTCLFAIAREKSWSTSQLEAHLVTNTARMGHAAWPFTTPSLRTSTAGRHRRRARPMFHRSDGPGDTRTRLTVVTHGRLERRSERDRGHGGARRPRAPQGRQAGTAPGLRSGGRVPQNAGGRAARATRVSASSPRPSASSETPAVSSCRRPPRSRPSSPPRGSTSSARSRSPP